MNTEIKIFTINGYNASVGNDIRYQVMPNGRIYQADDDGNYGEVSEARLNEIYEHIVDTFSTKNALKEKIDHAYARIFHSFERAEKDLKEILSDAGGFIKTLPSSTVPTIYATFFDHVGEFSTSTELVFGVRLIDGEIFLCTTTSTKNYEYDNDYFFDYLYDFEDGTEDKEHIEKLVNDTSHYISIEEDYIDKGETIYSILAGLSAYIK